MAEDLTDFMKEVGIRVKYLHSDIDTLERTEIIRDMRLDVFDVLVGNRSRCDVIFLIIFLLNLSTPLCFFHRCTHRISYRIRIHNNMSFSIER